MATILEAVHPHARGDNIGVPDGGHRRAGSPPRAWGQYNLHRPFVVRMRFTPTRVGTMLPPQGQVALASVHPHARGDNNSKRPKSASPNGSPPRAWGQCPAQPGSPLQIRFTPTRVGTM